MASSKNKQKGVSGKIKSDFFFWMDDKVKLLLSATNKFKVSKAVENVDWESCQMKYNDILDLYKQQYPSAEDSQSGEGRPAQKHKKEEITRQSSKQNVKWTRSNGFTVL